MTDFRILFDGSNHIALPDGYNLGVQGEHNAVQLVISLPVSMVQDMSYHVVTLGGVQSAIITDAAENVDGAYRFRNTIYFPLTAAYTKSCNADLTVTAYRQTGSVPTVVDKTPTVYGLRFSAGDAVDIPGGLVAQVAEIAKTQHTHPNKPTLDKLTEEDGTLYLDGKRLDGVIVWPIRKDPVIPAQPDGTLLYTVYGEDGLMNSDPYLVEIQGVLYRKPAPWKPGQLWVCRGGIWYLLTSEGKTNFDPSKVVQGGGDIIDGDLDDVYAPAPEPGEDESNSAVPGEVVLMPLNEPLTFRFREDFNEIPMYLTGRKSVTRNDSDSDWRIEFEIIIEETNGKKWSMNLFNDGLYGYYSPSIVFYDNVTAPEEESTEIYWFNGSEWKSFINGVEGNECLEIPDAKIIQVAGKTSIEELDTDELFYYKMFCQFVNTSVENMGVAHIIDGMIEVRTRGGLKWGRTYYQSMESDTEIMTIDTDSYSCGNDYIVLYFYCHGTMNVGLTDVDFFVGGVPDTQTEGWHKWIFNRLPNGQISLGSLDLEAVG